MPLRRTLALVTLTGLTGLTGLLAAPAANAAPSGAEKLGTGSLAAVLTSDGDQFDHNWDDYDILTEAVLAVIAAKPDSPVALLADGKVALTAFLPTDRAFQGLAHDLTGQQIGSEKKVFTTLVEAAGVDTIEAVLLYHVVPGATITASRVLSKDRTTVNTALPGASLTIATISKYYGIVRLRDLDTDSRDAFLLTSAVDINKGNRQIAHGISAVMRPVDLP